jgi:hypothetical protein
MALKNDITSAKVLGTSSMGAYVTFFLPEAAAA